MNASISSWTPDEGNPHRCPICHAQVRLQFSEKGDATCPSCGSLVWIFEVAESLLRNRLAEQLSVDVEAITELDLKADSLDVVSLVMDVEDEFEFTIPDSDYEGIKSIEDFLNYLQQKFPAPDSD